MDLFETWNTVNAKKTKYSNFCWSLLKLKLNWEYHCKNNNNIPLLIMLNMHRHSCSTRYALFTWSLDVLVVWRQISYHFENYSSVFIQFFNNNKKAHFISMVMVYTTWKDPLKILIINKHDVFVFLLIKILFYLTYA